MSLGQFGGCYIKVLEPLSSRIELEWAKNGCELSNLLLQTLVYVNLGENVEAKVKSPNSWVNFELECLRAVEMMI
jgi:hypothetical protein